MNINISGIGRKRLMSFTSGLCLATAVSAAMAAPPAMVPGSYGTLTIGDLPGTIDRVGALASKINPGMSGEAIKSLLGMQLGDAGLASIPSGSGLSAVFTKSGQPFFLLETAEGKAEKLAETIKQRGPQVEVISDKLLAIAMDESGIAAAKGETGTAAAAQLAKSDGKSLFFTVDADQLVADKGDDLKSFLKKLPAQMAAKGDAKSSASAGMVNVAGNAVIAVGKRTDVATIEIDISEKGIRFEKTLYPVGGVTLAKAEGPTGEDLLKTVSANDNAMTTYESYMDTQSGVKVLGDLINESLAGSDVSAEDKAGINALMATASEGFGDALAGWFGMDAKGGNGVYVISVLNKDKAIQYLEDGIKQMNDGALGKLYDSMGIETSTTLTKNAGTVEGETYHTFSVSIKPENADAMPSMSMMQNINDAKVTVVNDKMVIAIGSASLEDAVKAVKAGSAPNAPTLKAKSELAAEGGAFYADYNVGALGSVIKKDNAQIGTALESLKGSPILEAFYVNPDNVKFTMLIPSELISKAIAGFQNAAAAGTQDDDSDDDKSTAPSQNE